MKRFARWCVSLKCALAGLRSAFRTESNLRWHGLFVLLSGLLALFLSFSVESWAILLVTWGLVVSAELLNTAIEKLADIIQPQHDERIRQVKDISAAAVLVTAIVAALVGLLLFVPPLWEMILGKVERW